MSFLWDGQWGPDERIRHMRCTVGEAEAPRSNDCHLPDYCWSINESAVKDWLSTRQTSAPLRHRPLPEDRVQRSLEEDSLVTES